MKLTAEQEDAVQHYVESHKLKIKTLSDDLIDHLCCVIESQLDKGKHFEELLNDAMKELAPDGLADLERKTFFLLNFNQILIMKKVTYLIGFIGTMILTLGMIFKAFHLSGAPELVAIGTLGLLLFIPLFAFDKYKVDMAKNIPERIKVYSGVAVILLWILGSAVKILNFPGSYELMILSLFVLAIGFLPFLFFTLYKKSVS